MPQAKPDLSGQHVSIGRGREAFEGQSISVYTPGSPTVPGHCGYPSAMSSCLRALRVGAATPGQAITASSQSCSWYLVLFQWHEVRTSLSPPNPRI